MAEFYFKSLRNYLLDERKSCLTSGKKNLTEKSIAELSLEIITKSEYIKQEDVNSCGVILILAIEKICSSSSYSTETDLFQGVFDNLELSRWEILLKMLNDE